MLKQYVWLITAWLFLMLWPFLYAEGSTGKDKETQEIRAKCAAIDSGNGYKKVQIDVPDQSAEGGVAVGYFDGNKLRKITEKLNGEMGEMTSEYYFDIDKLIFVFIQNKQYERPQTLEKASAEGFGPIARIENIRCYFLGNKLIRKQTEWMDSSGHGIANPGPDYSPMEISEIDLVKGAEELKRRISVQMEDARDILSKDPSDQIQADGISYAPKENEEPVIVRADMDGDKKDEAIMAMQMYTVDANESPRSFASALKVGEDGKAKALLMQIPLNEFLGISVDDNNEKTIEVMDLNDDGKTEVAIWSSGGMHYHSLIIVGMSGGKVVELFNNGSRCPVEYDPSEDKKVISVGREDWPKHSYADGTYLEEIWTWNGKEFVYDKAKSTSPRMSEDEDIEGYWKLILNGDKVGEIKTDAMEFETKEEEKAWEYNFKHAQRGVW